MTSTWIQYIAAGVFGLALLHTFFAKVFKRLAHRYPRHAGLLHLLGEVEIVFGVWAAVLIVMMALVAGGGAALAYTESRNYTEPLFVFVVMIIAATRPIVAFVMYTIDKLARWMPADDAVARVWLGLSLVPLSGSLVTEPAAMTIAALVLGPQVFRQSVPEWHKYSVLGVLFVNISIGGTLTAYAAPPVLMVASAWNWDSLFMLSHIGWKAAVAVVINATLATFLIGKSVRGLPDTGWEGSPRDMSASAIATHIAFLAAIVVFSHHPVIFVAIFLFFIGCVQAYPRSQDRLLIKEAISVAFFLAGLVILGGMQQWWLQPLVSGLEPAHLFISASALTAITDNAALTYLGSLIASMSDEAKYMLVTGAVVGGGLTIIANAPNPVGAALLREGFRDESIGAAGLLAAALLPTMIAAAMFFFF